MRLVATEPCGRELGRHCRHGPADRRPLPGRHEPPGRHPRHRHRTRTPQDANVTSISPTTNLSDLSPGTWGYVIAFTATDQPIRDYVTEHTGFSGENIENDRTTTESPFGLEDVDLNAINNPWSAGFGDTILLIERPLGRGWLIIIGGGR